MALHTLIDGHIIPQWSGFLEAVVTLAHEDHAHRRRRRSGNSIRVLLTATGSPYRRIHDKLASGVYNLARRELEARDKESTR
jgi:hypothetical protein